MPNPDAETQRLLALAQERGITVEPMAAPTPDPETEGLLAEAQKRGLQVAQLSGGQVPMSAATDMVGPPEPPEEGPSVLSQAASNLLPSAKQFAADLTQPIRDPIGTAKALGNLALGAGQKLIPGEQEEEQYADAVGQFFADRYGGMDALKKTMGEDPVGFLADISTVMTGGGSLAARAPGIAGKFGKALAEIGQAVEPATAAGRLAARTGRGLGRGAAEVLGVTSGVGGESIKTAARAGMEGGEAAELLRASMRGQIPLDETVVVARNALNTMRQRRGEAYRAGMGQIRGDQTILDFGPIDAAMNRISDVKTFKGRSISKSTEGVRQQIADEVAEWKTLDPADFHTAEGLDALKQSVGDIREATPFGSPERKVADDAYRAIKDTIVQQAPEYAQVMDDYWQASEHLKEIEKALSLGPTASTDTALRKLQSIVRNDVSSAYGKRGDLAGDLEQAGATGLRERVAGQALENMAPRGISRLIPGAGVAGAMIDPAALAALPLSSPRLVGEAAHATGRAARLASPIASRLSPKVMQLLRESGRLARPGLVP